MLARKLLKQGDSFSKMDFATTFQRQRPALIFTEATALVCAIGLLDLVTGYEVSLSILYAFPIYVVGWCLDKKSGVLISLMCGIVWWWASVGSGKIYLNSFQEIWETLVRIAFFIFVAIAAASLKREQDAAASRIALLEHSRRLEREIIEISEREQRRIGRDLHDGLCQYQAALACSAASLNGDLMRKNLVAEAKQADELARRLRDAVAQTRDLARGLVPVQTEETGLVSALQELATSVSKLLSIDCRFAMHGRPPAFETTAATHLYRIAQEAVNNSTRHGKAGRIEICLTSDDEVTLLRISDNGLGISRTAHSGSGMGLNIMNYRAKLVGGELLVEAPEESGTVVSCLIRTAIEEANERAA
jgi:signal transduction histidine kinase